MADPRDHDFETVLYRHVTPDIVRVSMNRVETRNSQNTQLTYDLNAAFDRANADDQVKVIILAGEGPHFSSGHDMKGGPRAFQGVGTWQNYGAKGAEGPMAVEEEIYLQMCRRWRNIPKPMLAEVQGACIAGGLMLAWVCDIIVASDDARFRDLVVGWGIPGVEFFGHPWELGHRRAREVLYTGDWFTAQEAHQWGMVNHVVPRAELRQYTEEMAKKIADKPLFGLKLTKEAINQTLDAQGQWSAMQTVFVMHTLAHTHWREVNGNGAALYQGESAPKAPGRS
ncbi:MAG: enoyl-CoA hydratase [Chloroflexi bacterium]|nr:enoyl-CoA hydratase [Chloroflexota bacterium]